MALSLHPTRQRPSHDTRPVVPAGRPQRERRFADHRSTHVRSGPQDSNFLGEDDAWNFVASGQEPPSMEKPEKAPGAPLSSQEVAELMKMGSWRLGRLAIPQIELLVSQVCVEPCWTLSLRVYTFLEPQKYVVPPLSPPDAPSLSRPPVRLRRLSATSCRTSGRSRWTRRLRLSCIWTQWTSETHIAWPTTFRTRKSRTQLGPACK